MLTASHCNTCTYHGGFFLILPIIVLRKHKKINLVHNWYMLIFTKTDPRFSIVSGRSLKICPIDSVDGPPPNAHLF